MDCLPQLTCYMELTDATSVFVAAHVTTFNVHCKLVITCSQQLIMN